MPAYMPMATKRNRATLKRKTVNKNLFEDLTEILESRGMRMGMVYHLQFFLRSQEFNEPYFVVKLVDKASDPFKITSLWFSATGKLLKETTGNTPMLPAHELY